MENINIGTAAGLSVLGFLIVFIVLVLLMTIIYLMGAIMKAVNNKKASVVAAPQEVAAPEAATPVPAKGSCGDLTLVKVSERDAAMIMAITADQLKTPLNELRFISIKEAE